MRTLILLLIISLFSLPGVAQVKEPMKWTFGSKKISADTYEIHLTATMEKGWHTYSQKTPPDGPVPVTIKFSKNPLVTLSGEVKELGKLEKHYEPIFGTDVLQYSNKVDFVQTLTAKGAVQTLIVGTVEFMTCNDKECLPPKTENFSIPIK